MKVSIITGCLNSAKTIEQTIRSVVGQMQSYENIEYIIIDGGSTDGTLDIIRKYEQNVAYWASEPDRGIYDAMNKGIQKATGDIIGIINSDDWYAEDIIEAIVQFWQQHPHTECLYGNYVSVEVDGNKEHIKEFSAPLVISYPHPTVFVKKEIYDRIGLYDTDFSICADSDFMLRCQCNGIRFSYINKIIAYFRFSGFSQSARTGRTHWEVVRSLARLKEQGLMTDNQIAFSERILRTNRRKYLLDYLLRRRMPRYGILRKFLKQILIVNRKEKYVIWGTGQYGRYFYESFVGLEFLIQGFVDSDSQKQLFRFGRFQVFSPEDAIKKNMFIIIASRKYEDEIRDTLVAYGLKENKDFFSFDSMFDRLILYNIKNMKK